MLVVVCYLFVVWFVCVHCSLLLVGLYVCVLFVVYCLLCVVGGCLFVVCCASRVVLSLVVCRVLCDGCCELCVVCCLIVVVCFCLYIRRCVLLDVRSLVFVGCCLLFVC